MTHLNLKQRANKALAGFYDGWLRLTIGKLPRSYKRALFISSVYGLLKETTDPDMVNLKRLNDLLQTEYSREGLTKTLEAKSLIWRNLEKNPVVHCVSGDFCLFDLSQKKVIPSPTMHAAIDFIIRKTPTWLCYGSSKLMEHDLTVLLRNLGKVDRNLALSN